MSIFWPNLIIFLTELETSLIFFSPFMKRNTNQLTYVEVRLTHDSFPCEFTVDEIEPTVHLTLAVSAGLSIKAIYCYPSLLVCIHLPTSTS